MSSATATTNPRSRAKRSAPPPVLYIVASLVVYGLVLVGVEWGVRWGLLHRLPQLRYLAPGRLRGLLAEHFSAELTYRVAFLSFPLTMAVLLVRLHDADPFRELGLRLRHVGWVLWGWCLGVAARVALLAVAVWLSGGSANDEFARWRSLAVEFWVRGASRSTAAIAALALCYALGRCIVPCGHLHQRVRQCCRQPWGSLAVAAVFALPFLADNFLSPVGLLNALLLGLVLERCRARGGNLWLGLGLLAGWTALGVWDSLLFTTPQLGAALAAALPRCISGGVGGLDGGLLATLLWSGWLAWLLRPVRQPVAATVAAATEPVAADMVPAAAAEPGEGLEQPFAGDAAEAGPEA